MSNNKGFLSGLIMEGTRIEGKLSFKDKMRIDGEFIGEISSNDQLIVGKNAKINAEIKAGEIILMGQIKGQITHCNMLQINEGGEMIGDICVKTLDIKPGGVFEGNCAMIKSTVESKK